jgi:DUF2953 family protein
LILETVVIVILLALLLLIIAFLVIPLNISFKATRTGDSTEGEVTIRWLGVRLIRRKTTGGPPAEKTPEKGHRRVDFLKIVQLLGDSGPALRILLGAFRKAISIRRLSARAVFGVGDPAETAILCGYAWSFTWALNLIPRVSLVVEPDLEALRLDGSVGGEVGVRILPLLVGFLRAYLKKPFRMLIKEMRRRE